MNGRPHYSIELTINFMVNTGFLDETTTSQVQENILVWYKKFQNVHLESIAARRKDKNNSILLSKQ